MSGIALVTGASRGLGRGIARALGAEGWTVWITGRDEAGLEQAAQEIRQRGGTPLTARCDHGDDAQVAALFARIRAESGGIDLLVNNAAAVHQQELVREGPFWEKDLALADMITVGLRSSYVAAWHAAPLMLGRGGALIVNISFYGAVSYFHGPAYGSAKAGTDKMTYDMGRDFAATDVTIASFWPGYVLTDDVRAIPVKYFPPDMQGLLPEFETPEFSGHVIAALARDPQRRDVSGKALIGAVLARGYGITDEGGKQRRDWSDVMGEPACYPLMD